MDDGEGDEVARLLDEARQHLANAGSGHNLTWAVSKLLDVIALQDERLRTLEARRPASKA